MLNGEMLCRSPAKLDTFKDTPLKLIPKSSTLSVFHYNWEMLRGAAMNTCLETVGSRADSIHMAIKSVQPSDGYREQFNSRPGVLRKGAIQQHGCNTPIRLHR